MQAAAVALANRLQKLGARIIEVVVQPLLELIENDQYLGFRRVCGSFAKGGGCLGQAGTQRQAGKLPSKGREQASFGAIGRGFDVNRHDVRGQPGKQPCLHQRRLAAPRWTVDQADGKRPGRVGCVDAGFPCADRFGHALAVARAGQEPEEEIGVLDVESAQAFGDDANFTISPVSPAGEGLGGDRGGRGGAGEPELEVFAQVGGGLITLGHELGEAFQADALELTGHLAGKLARGLGVAIEDLVEDLVSSAAGERRPAGQAEVKDDAQGPDVSAAVEPMGFAADLFGGHEPRCARDFAPLQALKLFINREAEVADERFAAAVDQDVRGFQVAVHQAGLVGVVDGVAHPNQDLDQPGRGETLVLNQVGQRASADVFEHDVEGFVPLGADVEHPHDRRVPQARGEPGLPEQRLELPARGDRLRLGHLDGDLAIQLLVACQVNGTEPAAAQNSGGNVSAEAQWEALDDLGIISRGESVAARIVRVIRSGVVRVVAVAVAGGSEATPPFLKGSLDRTDTIGELLEVVLGQRLLAALKPQLDVDGE